MRIMFFVLPMLLAAGCLKKDKTQGYYRLRVRDIQSNPIPFQPGSPMADYTMQSNTLNFDEVGFDKVKFTDNGLNYIFTTFNENGDSLKFVFGKFYKTDCNYAVVPYEGDHSLVGINCVAIYGKINRLSKSDKLIMNEFSSIVQLSARYIAASNTAELQYSGGNARTGPAVGSLVNYTPVSFHFLIPLP